MTRVTLRFIVVQRARPLPSQRRRTASRRHKALKTAFATSTAAIRNKRLTSKPDKLILVLTRDKAVGFALPDADADAELVGRASASVHKQMFWLKMLTKLSPSS